MKKRFGSRLGMLLAMAATAFSPGAHASDAPSTCTARSAQMPATVVELYTSEGCSSCPPADRWLSTVAGSDDVVALAYHVDYWDRLGWKDRFASPAFTQRQLEQRSVNGARFAYTPQVVVNGRDRSGWYRTGGVERRAGVSPVSIELSRSAAGLRANVRPVDGVAAPARLAAFWAVTESGHRSIVKAGENDGATLHHDHVVRELKPVPAWAAEAAKPLGFTLPAPTGNASGVARRIVFVVIDAATGRPVQAVSLAC